MKTFILASIFLLAAQATSGELPAWITKGPMSDATFDYVVCSHDGIDPEEAKQIAESKCLASAAKLDGVQVRLTQKTVQSLTGADSSEVAEIQPLESRITCEWTDRFLEKIENGFRAWLRCKTNKAVSAKGTLDHQRVSNPVIMKHTEGKVILSTIPVVDRIIVTGFGAERVIEPTSNVVTILISDLDRQIIVRKTKYKDHTIELPRDLLHGSTIHGEVVLELNQANAQATRLVNHQMIIVFTCH